MGLGELSKGQNAGPEFNPQYWKKKKHQKHMQPWVYQIMLKTPPNDSDLQEGPECIVLSKTIRNVPVPVMSVSLGSTVLVNFCRSQLIGGRLTSRKG
jgi:hypothetical protein